jgi:hypothetical protein
LYSASSSLGVSAEGTLDASEAEGIEVDCPRRDAKLFVALDALEETAGAPKGVGAEEDDATVAGAVNENGVELPFETPNPLKPPNFGVEGSEASLATVLWVETELMEEDEDPPRLGSPLILYLAQ